MESVGEELGGPRPLLLSLPQRAEATDIEQLVVGLEPDNVGLATELVFRVPPRVLRDLRVQPRHLLDLRKRVPDLPLSFLAATSSQKPNGARGRSPTLWRADHQQGLVEVGDDEKIRSLCQQELAGLATMHESALLNANDHYHYIAPSGAHCASFFRVGDALMTNEANEALSFWAGEALIEAGAVILDTWAISSVLLAHAQTTPTRIPYGSLPCHPRFDLPKCQVEVARVERIRRQVNPDRPLLFLVSVMSTGDVVERIRNMCVAIGCTKFRVLGLYALKQAPATSDVLCRLPIDPGNLEPDKHGECSLCRKNSRAIVLDSSLYYAKEQAENPVVLRRQVFGRAKPLSRRGLQDFFSRIALFGKRAHKAIKTVLADEFSGAPGVAPFSEQDCIDKSSEFFARHHRDASCFRVHHTGTRNHRGFFVDVLELSRKDLFRARVRAVVDGLPTPDVILVPEDHASRGLANEIANIVGVEVVEVNPKNISNARFTTAANLLVVDDCLITGARLGAINAELRRICSGRDRKFESVSYVVGLARPPSSNRLGVANRSLTMGAPWSASLHAVETCILPDWGTAHCPWCAETSVLEGISHRLGAPPQWLESRISMLNDEMKLYESPLLLLGHSGSPPTLAPGSFLGAEGMTANVVLFRLASALQILRAAEKKPLRPFFPNYSVFSPENFSHYSEALIQAALLRTVAPQEWGKTGGLDIGAALVRSISDMGNVLVLGEVFVAAARTGPPRTVLSQCEAHLRTAIGDDARILLDGFA